MRTFTDKQKQQMKKTHDAYFASIGATLSPEEGSYIISTICGDLQMKSFGDWIATRFHDVARAKVHVPDMNPYSGKWNFHWLWSKNNELGKAVFTDFQCRLQYLLPKS